MSIYDNPKNIHVPFNAIFQAAGEGRMTGIFQYEFDCKPSRLLATSCDNHLLVMGDALIRPHLVASTDVLVGRGLTDIARHGFAELSDLLQQDPDQKLNIIQRG